MKQAAFLTLIVVAVTAIATWAAADERQPNVIYDSGDSFPLSDLFGVPDNIRPPDSPEPNLAGAFPVETPSMGLGRFASATWPDEAPWRGDPLFLIGSDAHSLAWLKIKRARLKEIGAAGLLIEANSESDLLAARAVSPDLQIIAASAEEIANYTGLRLYPVLITREGIEQ